MYGGVPPLATSITVPSTSMLVEDGVMPSALVTSIGADAVRDLLSVTMTSAEPATAEVYTPVVEPMPPTPDTRENVYGGVPPAAVNVCVPPTMTVADVGVMVSGGGGALTVTAASAVCSRLSVTRTVAVPAISPEL